MSTLRLIARCLPLALAISACSSAAPSQTDSATSDNGAGESAVALTTHAAAPTATSSTPAAASTAPADELPKDHFFNDSARMQEEITLYFGPATFAADEIDGEQVLRAVNPTDDELIAYPGEATNTVNRLRIIDVNARAETSMEGSPDSSPIFPLVTVFFPEGTIDTWMLETIQRGIDTPAGVSDSEIFGHLKMSIEAFTTDHDDEIVIDIERVN